MECKLFKLVNGDDVIAQTEEGFSSLNDSGYINLIEPILVSSIKITRDNFIIETFVMKPWLKLSKEDEVQVSVRNIVAVTDVIETAKRKYFQYLETKQPMLEVDPDEYDDIDEGDSEEDDNDGCREGTPSKTLH